MIKQSDKYIKLLLIVLVAVASSMCILLAISVSSIVNDSLNRPKPTTEPVDNKIAINGSHASGYYSNEFDFSMTCNDEDARIIYTITSPLRREVLSGEKTAPTGEKYLYSGGKLPDPAMLNEKGVRQSQEYTEPIKVEKRVYPAAETVRATTIVAAAFKDNERVSDYYYFTFFVDKAGNYPNYADKFGAYLVSITIDEEYLYGYEEGIFITGKAYMDEVMNNPGRDLGDPWYPKNYNQRGVDWERKGHIQIFNSNGVLVIDQDVGIRVAGGMSRHNSVKSLRIITRDIYDEKNDKLRYMFFEDAKDVYGNEIKEFDRIILRNSANDFGQLMFKDAFLHKLGGLAGVDYQESAPSTVYINGKYYSFMNIRESMDNDYIEAHYKIPKDQVTMVSIASGVGFSFNYKLTSGPEDGLKEFKADMRKIIQTDYTNKDISEIDKIIDVDNFIKYMAYQMYIANADWPHNNTLAWKYCDVPNSSVYGMDGKWRFILKDLDLSSSFTSYDFNAYANVLGSGMSGGDPAIGQVFKSCIKNKEFRVRFRDYMYDLCTELITKEIVTDLLDDFRTERSRDMEMFWLYYGGNRNNWYNLIKTFNSFPAKRAQWMLDNLYNYI